MNARNGLPADLDSLSRVCMGRADILPRFVGCQKDQSAGRRFGWLAISISIDIVRVMRRGCGVVNVQLRCSSQDGNEQIGSESYCMAEEVDLGIRR